MIEVAGVHKEFGRTPVLRDIWFNAGRGEIVLLLGDNGAGKTTLLRTILGITGYRGSIAVDGLDPLRDGKEVRRRIGYLPQSGGLHLDLSVGDTLHFYGGLRGVSDSKAHAGLESVGLEDEESRRVGELSVGMRQRLGFAVATLGDPPILLLDEPTASLDRRSRRLLVERLREQSASGRTILLSTHSEHYLVALTHRALRLEDGRLAA